MDGLLHIPCKSTSVRCPGKNLALIGGKPSVCWVIEAALESGLFNRIIISTDGDDVRRAVDAYPVGVVLQSPSTVIGTTHDIMEEDNYEDRITIMLPTVCLLTPDDIRGAIDESNLHNDPVMAVIGFPYRLDEVVIQAESGYVHRSLTHGPPWIHDNDPQYLIDAGAIYTFPPGHFRNVDGMYVYRLRPYRIPRYRGVDVNEPEDLELIRQLVGGREWNSSS
jgi:CMP-N-acetylneuraminic acid synthetase